MFLPSERSCEVPPAWVTALVTLSTHTDLTTTGTWFYTEVSPPAWWPSIFSAGPGIWSLYSDCVIKVILCSYTTLCALWVFVGKPISIWIMEVDTNRAVIRKLFWQQHFVTEHRETKVIKLAIKGVDLWVLERILVQGLFMIIAHQNVFLHFYCWQITCKPTRELMIFPPRPCNFVLVYIYPFLRPVKLSLLIYNNNNYFKIAWVLKG